MPSLGPFIGFGNGTLLFFTFAAVGVTFNLVLDMVMRRVVSPEVRHRAGPTAAHAVRRGGSVPRWLHRILVGTL